MKISSSNCMRFTTVAVAMLFSVGATPLIAHAQVQAQSISDNVSSTTVLLTSDHDVHLSLGDNICTATTGGENDISAIAIADDGRAWCWTTSSSVPSPLDVKMTSAEITFRREARMYVIRDASAIAKTRELFASFRDATKKQAAVSRDADERGVRERETGPNFTEMRVSVPDLSAEFQNVEVEAKRLSAEGATQSELSELQSEINELQSRISEVQSEAIEERASERRSELSSQVRAMSEQMQAMSREMRVWNTQVRKAAEQAARDVSAFLDLAVRNGTAKPE